MDGQEPVGRAEREESGRSLPAGTKLDAQFIDVTFQFFQLLTGAVTINAFAVHGANLKLDLDEKFFADRERQMAKTPEDGPKLSTGFMSKVSLGPARAVQFPQREPDRLAGRHPDHRGTKGRFLLTCSLSRRSSTVGRSSIDGRPTLRPRGRSAKALIELNSFASIRWVSCRRASAITEDGIILPELHGVAGRRAERPRQWPAQGQHLLKPKTLKADLSYIVKGRLPLWLDPELWRGISHQAAAKTGSENLIDGVITVDGRLTADVMDLERTLQTKATVEIENAEPRGLAREQDHAQRRVARARALAVDSGRRRYGGRRQGSSRRRLSTIRATASKAGAPRRCRSRTPISVSCSGRRSRRPTRCTCC